MQFVLPLRFRDEGVYEVALSLWCECTAEDQFLFLLYLPLKVTIINRIRTQD